MLDEKRNNNSFKNLHGNLALNLANKLPYAPNKYDLDSAFGYFKRFLNTENQKCTFSPTSQDEILAQIIIQEKFKNRSKNYRPVSLLPLFS